ncbi:MAG: type II toxin-antitoxin system RelE/ParE family toxin [Bryobacteraceae bacterium]
MSAYALHPEAFSDLDEIRGYIAENNPDAADRVITEIFDGIRTLSAFPYQGYRRPALTSRRLRFKLVGEYVIAYVPEKKPLWIVAVIHGRRSPRVMAAILRGRE